MDTYTQEQLKLSQKKEREADYILRLIRTRKPFLQSVVQWILKVIFRRKSKAKITPYYKVRNKN